jgi:hypothetical protein
VRAERQHASEQEVACLASIGTSSAGVKCRRKVGGDVETREDRERQGMRHTGNVARHDWRVYLRKRREESIRSYSTVSP